jgi:Ca2+/H+ antiporter, TMEM165/GDT1 family
MLETFLTSIAVVAFAEIGDKTMLLALLLAARLRQPVAILGGIFAATIANHALAALLGQQVTGLLDSEAFRIAVAAGFVIMGIWTLIPDKIDDDMEIYQRGNAFFTTLVAFFLVEMGDKTQIATVALGAQFRDVTTVAAGTTIGMMIANAPAVLFGDRLLRRVSLNLTRMIAAALFVALGVWQLVAIFNG